MNKNTSLALATLALLTPLSAPAEDRFPSLRGGPFQWGLGLGALVEDEGYAGMGAETNGQPLLYLSGERFRFLANQADYQFFKNEHWLLGIKAEARFDGFEPEDADIFAGMEEREGGVFGGLRVEYRSALGNLVAEYADELSGESGGAYGSLGSYWVLPLGAGEWVPKVALEVYDSNYVDYYYGVRPEEATELRPAYRGDTLMNLDLGFDYILDFGERHHLLSSVKYRYYGSEAQDSPLIDAKGSLRFILGYYYSF